MLGPTTWAFVYSHVTVWIGDVDIPEELVAAARAGTLVLFVGAGASRDAPANLPDFRLLTEQIATEAAIDIEPGELDKPDELLGRIADLGVDVHLRVRSLIDAPGSWPNLLHGAIVDLAKAMPTPRIVTTNYDSHLTTVICGGALAWDEYMAPALPMGNEFSGVVYLHGSLRQPPKRLIVTDADFGRAYIRDAWAARFLERMFGKYTVLFIGYSHGDVVMRYLARSLGPQSDRRYVLTHDPDASDWRRLDLKPVGYRLRASRHSALPEAIGRWAALLAMGQLDHRNRIAQLVAAPPSEIPEEQSYMQAVLDDERLVGHFADLAWGEPWLRWVAAQPAFRLVLDSDVHATNHTQALADWFARHCVADELLSDVALTILSERGRGVSAQLWNAVGHHLHARKGARPAWLQRWIVLLVEEAPRLGHEWLELALNDSVLPADRDVALVLFDFLIEPHVSLKPRFGLGGAHFEADIRGNRDLLLASWTKIFKPDLASVVHEVLSIVDRHLRRVRYLLVAVGAANPGWDPTSFGRSSIVPHEQDRYGDGIDFLIDVGRDCLDLLVEHDPAAADPVVQAWASSEVPILRRLAIHAVAVDPTRSGTEKLAWLASYGWLFDYELKHEVFELLAMALPEADGPAVEDLVRTVVAGPPGDDENLRDYEVFNALEWIGRYSDAPSAVSALAGIRSDRPEFVARQHPDFGSWSEVGVRGAVAPMPIEVFHQRLRGDRGELLAELSQFKDVDFAIGTPSWHDVGSLVTQAVAAEPEDGFALLAPDTKLDPDLIRSTINGWAAADHNFDVAERILERLTELDLEQFGGDIARLLGGHIGTDQRTAWHQLTAARELARSIAHQLAPDPIPTDKADWLQAAINAPAGLLAEFWMHAISLDWNQNRSDWSGIPPQTREALLELMSRSDVHGALAEVIVTSQLHFVFAADRIWCEANVLPLLAWSDVWRARRTWDGFLFWGRWTDQLLEAGLLRHYLDATHHLSSLRDELERRLMDHFAGMALYSEINPLTWSAEFTRATPEHARVKFFDQVSWILDRLDVAARNVQWERWMRDYWSQRLVSVPLPLTADEASGLAEWAFHLLPDIPEAVDLAVSAPAGLRPHGVVHDLKKHVDHAPAELARLLAHVLSGTNPQNFWGCYELGEIVPMLHGIADESHLIQIREAGLRLGCPDAAGW
jgi:hypothetical protein